MRRRLERWFLAMLMSIVAFVVERRLVKAMARRR
jgi:hypothetical protein